LPAKKISQKNKIKKIYLKPQKDVGKTELKLPRSGFVHQSDIATFCKTVILAKTQVRNPPNLGLIIGYHRFLLD